MSDREDTPDRAHDEDTPETIPSLRDIGEEATPEQKERQKVSPEPGYPVGDTDPLGGAAPSKEHPEDIAPTASDEDEGEDGVTQSPGTPADPASG
jgi:hypothetical protein